jgi:hypothetical protein
METGTLTIEITTSHCQGGKDNDLPAGKIMVAPRDLSIEEAQRKVRIGYARFVQEELMGPGAFMPASGPASITHRDPAIDTRDPVIEGPAPAASAAPHKTLRGRTHSAGRRIKE